MFNKKSVEKEEYTTGFFEWFNVLENDGVNVKEWLFRLDEILVDFNQQQLTSLKVAIGKKFREKKAEEFIKTKISDYYIHFLRSYKRMVLALNLEEDDKKLVVMLASKISY